MKTRKRRCCVRTPAEQRDDTMPTSTLSHLKAIYSKHSLFPFFSVFVFPTSLYQNSLLSFIHICIINFWSSTLQASYVLYLMCIQAVSHLQAANGFFFFFFLQTRKDFPKVTQQWWSWSNRVLLAQLTRAEGTQRWKKKKKKKVRMSLHSTETTVDRFFTCWKMWELLREGYLPDWKRDDGKLARKTMFKYLFANTLS